jgi:hypothetical protein
MGAKSTPPGYRGQAPRPRPRETALRNIPGLKRVIKKVLRFDGRALFASVPRRKITMKKPSKTAAELEASIKVEMEDICDWPTDMTISVQPDGDSWKVAVMQEGSVDDADRRDMVEQIAARLKGEYDLKG